MPCHAMPCHAMPCHAMPCHAMPCHAMPCHAMPCHAMPCHAMPCHTIPYHTIPYHTIPYHTNTVPYYTMLYCIRLYYQGVVFKDPLFKNPKRFPRSQHVRAPASEGDQGPRPSTAWTPQGSFQAWGPRAQLRSREHLPMSRVCEGLRSRYPRAPSLDQGELLWGLKCINRTYFGLLGVSGLWVGGSNGCIRGSFWPMMAEKSLGTAGGWSLARPG